MTEAKYPVRDQREEEEGRKRGTGSGIGRHRRVVQRVRKLIETCSTGGWGNGGSH